MIVNWGEAFIDRLQWIKRHLTDSDMFGFDSRVVNVKCELAEIFISVSRFSPVIIIPPLPHIHPSTTHAV